MEKLIKPTLVAVVASVAALLAFVGCETVEAAEADSQATKTAVAKTYVASIPKASKPEPKPEAKPDTRAKRSSQSSSFASTRPLVTNKRPGYNYSWQAFPSSAATPKEAQILIEKSVPKEVRPGESYTYEITVTNRANYKTSGMSITERLPDSFRLKHAVPSPEIREQQLRWNLGVMTPGQRETITVTGHASRAGTMHHASSTDLNFNLGSLSSVVAVIEALFELNVESPRNSIIAESFPVRITFRNSGTAAVRDAELVHTLPKGLLTSRGSSKVELMVGDLDPGQSRTFNLELKGSDVGAYETTFVAKAKEGISAKATMATTVAKPELVLMAKAPSKRFVGNIIPYTITVKNNGNAVARNTVIRQNLSEGTALASATEGGTSEGRSVVWRIGSLAPGETKRLDCRVLAKNIMTARSTVNAGAVSAESVDAAVVTDIEGIAAILTEVGDLHDPVPVGENETYEIKAINQGSLPATRIIVKCILDEGMEFVQATGATKAVAEGNVVTFEPLPALDPQSTAQWRVIVKATDPGDVRFETSVISDQLSKPVTKAEATHFYK